MSLRLQNSLTLLCLALGGGLGVCAADIGDIVPAKAKIVATVRNLNTASEHVRAFADSIGVPIPQGFDVAQLRAMALRGDFWQLEKGATVVVMELNDKGMALVLPVSDAKAALAKLDATGDGDVRRVNFPPGQSGHAAVKDGFLILGPSDDIVKAVKAATKTLGAEFSKDAADTDLYVAVHISQMRPMIEQGLQAAQDQMTNLPIPAGQGDPELIAGMMKWYIGGIGSMARQTEGLYFSLDVAKDKVELEASAEFVEGSYCAQQCAKLTGGKNVLKGIPAGPFAFAMGMQFDGMRTLMRDITESMFNIPAMGKNLNAEQKAKMAAVIRSMYDETKSMGMVMGTTETGAMGMLGTYVSDDPEKLRGTMRDVWNASMAIMPAVASGLTGKWTNRNVDGMDVDELEYDFGKMPDEQKRAMQAIYGADSRVQLAVVGGALRFAMGGKNALAPFKASSRELADEARVAAVLAELPEGAPMVALVDLFGYATMILKILGNSPMPLPIPPIAMPKDPPPPVAVAVFGKSNSIYKHIIVRADTVKAVIDTIKPHVSPAANTNPPMQ